MAKGGRELLDDPVAVELLQSSIPARLAYRWRDGTPRVVPIWFQWNGSEVVMATPARAPKVDAVRTGDQVAVTIDGNDWPYRALTMRGPVTVTPSEGIVPEYAQAAVRYLGEEQGRAWLEQLPPGVQTYRLAVRPEVVTVIDFQTRFPSAIS